RGSTCQSSGLAIGVGAPSADSPTAWRYVACLGAPRRNILHGCWVWVYVRHSWSDLASGAGVACTTAGVEPCTIASACQIISATIAPRHSRARPVVATASEAGLATGSGHGDVLGSRGSRHSPATRLAGTNHPRLSSPMSVPWSATVSASQ